MAAVEVWGARGKLDSVTLEKATYTIGSDAESADITLSDSTVSRVHAVLERVGTAWLLRDVGSRNGTRVNSERLTGQRRMRHGEEILIGEYRLRFLDGDELTGRKTNPLESPPTNLTRMERSVLIELCRPIVAHGPLQEAASVREMAARLFVGKNAIQAHLVNLYEKFAIAGEADRRKALARKAYELGAVTRADLGIEASNMSGEP